MNSAYHLVRSCKTFLRRIASNGCMNDVASVASPNDAVSIKPAASRDAIDAMVETARLLVERGQKHEKAMYRGSRQRRSRLVKLLQHDELKELSFALTDRVVRTGSAKVSAVDFAAIVRTHSLRGLGIIDRTLLHVGARLARRMPRVVMPMVTQRLRSETKGVILPASRRELTKFLEKRSNQGFAANINVLGEAILGEREATRRLDTIVEVLRRDDVNYVSVKISAISSKISALAFDETVEAVAKPLRILYRTAKEFNPPKFVNLDMEEYRDLALTLAVFRSVLDEAEFVGLPAGIVLQAYLPDAHVAAEELGSWAMQRQRRGNARIKVRVVKGANLAMETVDAELHGWPLTTYGSKVEVDASYKRLLETLLNSKFDDCIDVGLASHNLFDIAWGLHLLEELKLRNVASRLSFEMLEGMASEHALAVRERAGSVLLYSPIVAKDDFSAAIAYLVRRLDENTTRENFLRSALSITAHNEMFGTEEHRFRDAVATEASLRTDQKRTQDRRAPIVPNDLAEPFENEPDTDFSLSSNRDWISEALRNWRPPVHPITPFVNGEACSSGNRESVSFTVPPHDSYAVELASLATIERLIAAAREGQVLWDGFGSEKQRATINRVGDVIATHRAEILVTMAHDAGKTIGEGDPEVSEAIDFARYYARQDCETSMSRPLGTVVVAPPWNFPYAIAMGGVLAALAAGNSVILKPAPQTILTGWLVASHCWEAGVPVGALQFAPCPDNEVGKLLITHPDVDAVILTGGFETASMFLDWKPSLRLHAETSGKNALVIAASADVDQAIKDLMKSAFGHAGQKCSAASLAIVDATLYDDPRFQERLRDAVTSLRVGAGWNLGTDVGPLIGPPNEKLLRALTVLDLDEEWLVQPARLDAEGMLWSPGIRLGVRENSWFHRHECFGPVLGVMRARDIDHAIELQNGSDFGLTAGIHSLNPIDIDRWTDRVEAGNLYVNRGITGAIVQRQPFGGWKRSVVGPTVKAGGPHYLRSLRRFVTKEVRALSDLSVTEELWRRWVADEFLNERDPSDLRAESNVLRWRPCSGGIVVRGCQPNEVKLAKLLSELISTPILQSFASGDNAETEEAFLDRVRLSGVDRVRLLCPVSEQTRRRLHEMPVSIDDAPMSAAPDVELPRWLREQSVTVTLHRHGHVVGSEGT